MQISKLMPLVCSTALCVSVNGIVQAEDNAAQAAARAALLEKMSDVNASPSSNVTKVITPDNTPTTAPFAPVQPAAPVQPMVALPALAPVPVTPVKQIVIPPDNDAQYRARTALLEKITEPEPQPAFLQDNDSQAKARTALLDKLTEPEPPPAFLKDSDAQAKARAALVEQLNQPEPVVVTPAPAPVAAAPTTPTPSPVAAASPTPASSPVVTTPALTPAQNVALTKEMRLKELLMKYQADEITPAEYHTKRAAIVNGE